MKLPKRIYVHWEEEVKDPFLVIDDDIDDLMNETEVGIYVLENVKTVKVTTELI